MADNIVTLGADLSETDSEFDKLLDKVKRIASKSVAEMKRLGDSSAKSLRSAFLGAGRDGEQALEGVKKAGTVMFGGVVGDIEDVGAALGGLGVGGAAVAVAGLVSVGGAVGGLMAAFSAIGGIEETEAQLDALGVRSALTAAQLEKLGAASDSIDRLSAVSLRAQEAFALASSDGVEVLTHTMLNLEPVILKVASAAGQLISDFALGVSVVSAFAEVVSDEATALDILKGAVTGGLWPMAEMADRMDEVLPLAIKNAAAGRELAQGYDGVAKSLKGAAMPARALAEGLAKMQGTYGKADTAGQSKRERELAEALAERARALEQVLGVQTKVSADIVQPYETELALLDAIGAKYSENGEIVSAVAEAKSALFSRSEREAAAAADAWALAQADTERAVMESAASTSASLKATVTEFLSWAQQMRTASVDAAVGVASDLAGSVAALGSALASSGALNKKAALAAFRTSQAAGLAQVGIDTVAAISKGFAMFGPPPSPVGIAAAAAAGAAGVANATAIATAPPPVLHGGGVRSGVRTPDEGLTMVRDGEGVLTPAGVRAVGGPSGLGRLNVGMPGSDAPLQIDLVHAGRTLDRVMADRGRRPGSALRELAGTPRQGQRRRR
jgi:hypothetical protein